MSNENLMKVNLKVQNEIQRNCHIQIIVTKEAD